MKKTSSREVRSDLSQIPHPQRPKKKGPCQRRQLLGHDLSLKEYLHSGSARNKAMRGNSHTRLHDDGKTRIVPCCAYAPSTAPWLRSPDEPRRKHVGKPPFWNWWSHTWGGISGIAAPTWGKITPMKRTATSPNMATKKSSRREDLRQYLVLSRSATPHDGRRDAKQTFRWWKLWQRQSVITH